MSNILILGMYTNHSFFLSNMPSFRHKRPRKQVGTTLFKECHYAFGLLFNQYVCDHHLIGLTNLLSLLTHPIYGIFII